MSIFGSILSKLGIGEAHAEEAPEPTTETPESTPEVSSASPVEAIKEVDVVANLEAMASANSQKLNWKVSIVDLMKLLGLDSSFSARKELAAELECPEEKMADSAQMNMWLHKTVLQKLAENGGNIPADLLD